MVPPQKHLPALSAWKTAGGGEARPAARGGIQVTGNRTTTGYQLGSPTVSVAGGTRVTVRTDLTVQWGRVCLGALNGPAGISSAPPDYCRDPPPSRHWL